MSFNYDIFVNQQNLNLKVKASSNNLTVNILG